VLLFQRRFHAGLVDGTVTLTFRLWDRPHVKPGGLYRCHPIGVLRVDDVDQVAVGDVSDADARRAGFASRQEMLETLAGFHGAPLTPRTVLTRVALHHAGDGDHAAGALDANLRPEDVAALAARLARLDAKRPWTAATLDVIAKHPRTPASRLAASLGRETAPFKADVVKLKRLGLTQSFEVGYEVTPRGCAFLEASRVGGHESTEDPDMARRRSTTGRGTKPERKAARRAAQEAGSGRSTFGASDRAMKGSQKQRLGPRRTGR
jgi:hypothetical protein